MPEMWEASCVLLPCRQGPIDIGEELVHGNAVDGTGIANRLERRNVAPDTVHTVIDEDPRSGRVFRQKFGNRVVCR